MAKVTRKGKVRHITLDPKDEMSQVVASMKLTVPNLIDYLLDNGLYCGYDEVDVEYDQDHEGNYVRPKGHDMGDGRYWVGGSPLCVGVKHCQDALRDGFRDRSRM